MIIFPASNQRPPDYPERLPFIPDALVEISEFSDAAVMKWFAVERPFDVVQQLTGASVKEGWRAVTEADAAAPAAPRLRTRLTIGDLERDIEVVQAGPFTSVVLRQRHREG